MEEMQLELVYDDFYKAADKLYLTLSIKERNELVFNWEQKEKYKDPNVTFKPKINKNTMSI